MRMMITALCVISCGLGNAAAQSTDAKKKPYVPGTMFALDYRSRYAEIGYEANIFNDTLTPVEDRITQTGSDLRVRVTPFISAYVSVSDELFPDRAFDSEFYEASTPDAARDLGYAAAAFGILVKPLPFNVAVPAVTYERRNFRGDFTTDIDMRDEAGGLIAPEGGALELSDEQTWISLQWGDDPRYSVLGVDASGARVSDRNYNGENAFQVSFNLTWVQSDSLFFEFDDDDAFAVLRNIETSSFNAGLALRSDFYRSDNSLFIASWGIETSLPIYGERSLPRFGGYLGAYVTPVNKRVSFGTTVGAYTLISDSEYGGLLGGDRISEADNFGTIELKSGFELTAGLAIRI
ncbi:MAG: hypothetical protein AAFR11_05970 [Pseudomonadota bacterium]